MANNKKIKKESKHKKFYYSYNRRLTVNVIMFVVTLLFGLFFLKEAFTYEDAKVVNYSEHSNLDYKVYLKENYFYDEDYLPKDMLYVANLIDNIKVDFDYKFLIEEQIDLKFDYKILGKLVISDQNEENVYYEKTYDLLGNKSVTLSENTSKNITETIVIDYSKYNKIANTFKSSYGLTTKSKLIVYFTVNKEVLNDNFSIGNSINNMVLNIPLSEQMIIKVANLINASSIYISEGYRNYGEYLAESNIPISNPKSIRNDMLKLINDYYHNWKDMDPFEREARFHIDFIRIHPFEDGNGRTGRLLLNFNLLSQNIPPVIITEDLDNNYKKFIHDKNIKEMANMFRIQSQKEKEVFDKLYEQYNFTSSEEINNTVKK